MGRCGHPRIRGFLACAVRHCVEQGVDQFLDLGSRMLTVGNVDQVARAVAPQARVAYVDNEPVTVAYSRELLADDALASVVHADLRDVEVVLDAVRGRELLDLSRPVALLSLGVMHFIPDDDRPVDLLARYRARLAPGSVHVLSHARADHDPVVAARAVTTYRGTDNPITPRSRPKVAALLGGLELAEPGLVDAISWRRLPDGSAEAEHVGYWAAVAHLR